MPEESDGENKSEKKDEEDSEKKVECRFCKSKFEDDEERIEHQKKKHEGKVCSYCGGKIKSMPHKCNYCGKKFCTSHRLPENHDCAGTEEPESLKDYADRNKREKKGSSDASDKVLGKNIRTEDEDTAEKSSNESKAKETEKSPKSEDETIEESGSENISSKVIGFLSHLRNLLGVLFSVIISILIFPLKLVKKGLNVFFSRNFWFFVFLAIIGFGLSQGDYGNSETINEEEVERKIHKQINEERTLRGLEPLEYSQSLEEIADYHSKDMLIQGYMAHTSPNGETMKDRYQKFDYNCAVKDGVTIYKGAENVAQTYYKQNIETNTGIVYHENNTELAKGIVNQWMNSEGHRENILKPYWENEGLGIKTAENPEGDGKIVYATQNFC